jgi:hypothetical protein
VNALGQALDAGARAAYGDGYDDLTLREKHVVRERVLPIFNAIFPVLRNDIVSLVEARIERTKSYGGRTSAPTALRLAAAEIREWPQ